LYTLSSESPANADVLTNAATPAAQIPAVVITLRIRRRFMVIFLTD
jgi:hypothetical protein